MFICDDITACRCAETFASCGNGGALNGLAIFGDPSALLAQVHGDQEVGLCIGRASEKHAHEKEIVLSGGKVDRVAVLTQRADRGFGTVFQEGDDAFNISP